MSTIKKELVENCESLDVNKTLKIAKEKLLEELTNLEIVNESKDLGISESIKFTKVSTGNSGHKYYFICPYCGSKSGKLYKHPLTQKTACRGCNGLEYRKRRYRGMVEE